MESVVSKYLKNEKVVISAVVFFSILLITFFFDKGLSVGLALLAVLSGITFLVFNKLGLKDKRIYILFLIVLSIHLGTALVMHYTHFQPFSGGKGDYLYYQKSAVEFSQSFLQGRFVLEDITLANPDLYAGHYYPAIVGAVYALTMPKEIIGLMLNVWLVAISVALVYLLILEIGGTEKNAFLVGIITALYPSYVFNSSLLLKDPFEIFFVVLGLLFLIKTIRKFSWLNFVFLYLSLLCATHFRFYIGFALIATFILSWFIFSKMGLKKRIIYGVMFVIVLGFIPQIAADQGYYGVKPIMTLINPRMISFYRQSAYNPSSSYNNQVTMGPDDITSVETTPAPATPDNTTPVETTPAPPIGLGSSFPAENTPLGYIKSFVYVLLGPLPWQIKNLRQALALFETIPWYLILYFVVSGTVVLFKKRIWMALPLLIFSIMTMVVIAVFDSNFGLIVRIRIPAFISLLCIASFSFNEDNIFYSLLYNFYKKGAR